MKFSTSVALAAITSLATALPATKVKRADDTPIGYASQNGGTTGGQGGTTTTVSSIAQFTQAVLAKEPTVVYVKGTIKADVKTKVSKDTSILGIDSSSKLEGVSLYIKDVSNVIVRNLAISKVLAETGDAIGIQKSTNVWIDHMDLSSDRDHDKDYYDGLCDVSHAADWVTISNTKFHDHFKASLVGHSDSNAKEDTGYLHVTYANNHWVNINSRAPSVRFGTAHIFNSYYDTLDTGVNTRMGAKVLIESTAFTGAKNAIQSKDSKTTGTAEVKDVDLGGGANIAPKGSFGTVPYKYTLLGASKVKSAVVGTAGNTIKL
ncbi:Putative pectate lyase, pectin lyase/virulence factor [Septoria linicola]|uniref:pectate lyase n=1 Tax=Septoria linicola TaxID=215465 RepID=A0A9Q9ATD0_9PEZI|nr:putative pectate lyase, pectin lyase/virulence factor [Septoria linicola]USW52823.1 Putative pectate lyase, pectin lyase/virulence factor [Septoria linicola]